MQDDTLSIAREVRKPALPEGAGGLTSYQNIAKPSIAATLPGEIGTPQERLEILQNEILNARTAGLSIRLQNSTSKTGHPVLVILVMDAEISDNCLWHVPRESILIPDARLRQTDDNS